MTARKTIRDIQKQKGIAPLVMLTAYAAPMAKHLDNYVDMLLVGDSLGMVLYGFDSTLPVTLEMMSAHGAAVVRGSERALVVVDMPFASYQESPEQAFRNAARLLKETGCTAVKIEGGVEMAGTIEFLTQRGIPVMGHVGLQPQSVHGAGGYHVQGRDEREAEKIRSDAQAVAESGAFAVVMECITPDLAAQITEDIAIPTIGIGASAACDGQVLVTDDMLGLSLGAAPKFVKRYADLASDIESAIESYAHDVAARKFPSESFTYISKKALKKAS